MHNFIPYLRSVKAQWIIDKYVHRKFLAPLPGSPSVALLTSISEILQPGVAALVHCSKVDECNKL